MENAVKYRKEILENFKNWMYYERGYSENTIKGYFRDITMYLECIGDPKHVTPEQLSEYLESRETARTRNRSFAAIRSFYHYAAVNLGYYNQCWAKIKFVKLHKYVKPEDEVLIAEEVEQFFSVFDTNRPHECRLKAMFALMWDCGISVTDVANLKWADIDFSKNTVQVSGEGYGAAREAYISDDLATLIQKQARLCNHANKYVFLSQKGVPYSRKSIWRSASVYGKKAGIKTPVGPNILRRSHIVELLKDAGTHATQRALGHRDISTTIAYKTLLNAKKEKR